MRIDRIAQFRLNKGAMVFTDTIHADRAEALKTLLTLST
jgi:hypothetical protein